MALNHCIASSPVRPLKNSGITTCIFSVPPTGGGAGGAEFVEVNVQVEEATLAWYAWLALVGT